MTKPHSISEAARRAHDNLVKGSMFAATLGDMPAAARLMFSAALELPKNQTGVMAMDKALRLFEPLNEQPGPANGTDIAIYATALFLSGSLDHDKKGV